WPRHLPTVVQYFFETFDTHRYHGEIELRRDHSDARTEAVDLAGVGSLAFRKNQHGVSAFHHLADVAQRLPGARLTLRQRKRVAEQRGQIVVQRIQEPPDPSVLLREKMRLEKLLRHRGCDTVAEPPR